MQCDFYECADLIDDLERLQTEQKKERLRQSRIKGSLLTLLSSVHILLTLLSRVHILLTLLSRVHILLTLLSRVHILPQGRRGHATPNRDHCIHQNSYGGRI